MFIGMFVYLILWSDCSILLSLKTLDSLSHCAALCMYCAQLLSYVWLFATPRTVAHQAPLSMGFSRQGYWSGRPFPTLQEIFPTQGSKLCLFFFFFFFWNCVSCISCISSWIRHHCATWETSFVSFSSVQFSHSVVSDSLRSHGSQHARPPCPSPTPGVHSDSRP